MGGWGRGEGERRKGGKEWETRGNKPKRKESEEGGKDEDGVWGQMRGLENPKKPRVEVFTVVEGRGKPWWRVYW